MDKKEKVITGFAAACFVVYAGFAYWAFAGIEDYATFWGVVRALIGARAAIACGQIVLNVSNYLLEKHSELS